MSNVPEIILGSDEEGHFFARFNPPISIDWLFEVTLEGFFLDDVEYDHEDDCANISSVGYDGAVSTVIKADEAVGHFVEGYRQVAENLEPRRKLRGPKSWLRRLESVSNKSLT